VVCGWNRRPSARARRAVASLWQGTFVRRRSDLGQPRRALRVLHRPSVKEGAAVRVEAQRVRRGFHLSLERCLRMALPRREDSVSPRVPLSLIVCRVLGRSIFAAYAAHATEDEIAIRGSGRLDGRRTRASRERVLVVGLIRQTGGSFRRHEVAQAI